LGEQSGFGWNEELELYKAYDYVWTGLNNAHPGIIWHKTHIMPFRDSISMILHDVQANGKASLKIEPFTNVSTLDPRLMAIQNNSALSSTSRSSSAPPKVGRGLYNKSRKREIMEITNDTDNAFQTPAKKIDLGVAITALLKEIAQSRQAKEAYKTN
jgi:hypothetical protein